MTPLSLIYKDISGFVYNVAFRITGNKQDAEEVTQEVFLIIYHKLKNFRFQSSLKTWAYRITVNCAINHSKKMFRETDRIKEYGETLSRLGEDINNPAREITVTTGKNSLIRFWGFLIPSKRHV